MYGPASRFSTALVIWVAKLGKRWASADAYSVPQKISWTFTLVMTPPPWEAKDVPPGTPAPAGLKPSAP